MDALVNGLFFLIGKLIELAVSTIFIISCFVGLIWVLVNWEEVLEWFYGLTPHPATDTVSQRIHGGGPIDGPLFAEIMRPVPGDPIEQRVRAEQARRLAEMAREAAQARAAQLERLRTKAVEEAAFTRAHEDLRKAMEEHELAVARLDALKKWRQRNG